MADLRNDIRKDLEKLAEKPGVTGAFLVSRDGINVVEVCKRPLNQEVFAAMSAMMMGAAETAVGELGEKNAGKVSVQTDKTSVTVRGASDDLLLVVLGDSSMKSSDIQADVEAVLASVKRFSAR